MLRSSGKPFRPTLFFIGYLVAAVLCGLAAFDVTLGVLAGERLFFLAVAIVLFVHAVG